MEGSVLSFLKAEWKVSDTGSAHWASSYVPLLLFCLSWLWREHHASKKITIYWSKNQHRQSRYNERVTTPPPPNYDLRPPSINSSKLSLNSVAVHYRLWTNVSLILSTYKAFIILASCTMVYFIRHARRCFS